MVDTSLDAWSSVKKTLSVRQKAVYETVRARPGHTAAEIARIMRCHTNSSSPRITELLRMGKVVRTGRRTCSVTGGSCHTFEAVAS